MFIYSTSEGNSNHFHFGIIVNNASMKIPGHIFWCSYGHISLGYMPSCRTYL